MVFKSIIGTACACLAMVSFNVNAALIDNGTYTSDDVSGLDWLDVTETAGLSYNDVQTQLAIRGLYEGWMYATAIQFNELISNYVGYAVNGGEKPNYFVGDRIDGLVVLLGSTLDTSYLDEFGATFDATNGYAEGDGVDFSYGLLAQGTDWGPRRAMIMDDNREGMRDYSDAYEVVSYPDDPQISIGSYLIRTSVVPVPAAVWLFGSGLIGLIGFARRK